jgi:uncharacterized iron-regulated membrane protein
MGFLQRWMRRPQNVWVRRALFQIHLWTGIGAGLYMAIIGLTGSVLIFRPELLKNLQRGPRIVTVTDHRWSNTALTAAAMQQFPDYKVSNIWDNPRKPEEAVEIWLDRAGAKTTKQVEFDQYTGKYLGSRQPFSVALVTWTLDLHVNLLTGGTGKIVNGWGGACLALLAMTGIIIWWPGISSWKRSLTIPLHADWKAFNWNLHSAVGFWLFLLMLMFGITGAYLVFQMPFQRAINAVAPLKYFSQDPVDDEEEDVAPPPQAQAPAAGGGASDGQAAGSVRVFTFNNNGGIPGRRRGPRYSTGDLIIVWMGRLHYGRSFGEWMKWAYVGLGLVPPLLFITGFIMWWNRSLSPASRRAKRNAKLAVAGASLPALDAGLGSLASEKSSD